MDTYKRIEQIIAKKYKRKLTTKKSVGDFMLDSNHAVNIKSNNIEKENYSPNLISIKKMHEWVFKQRKKLSFIFVDYTEKSGKIKIEDESALIPIESISWDCLSIEAQGYGVIQKNRDLEEKPSQTKREFYKGFLTAYAKYRGKELEKHKKFSKTFIKDLDSIDG